MTRRVVLCLFAALLAGCGSTKKPLDVTDGTTTSVAAGTVKAKPQCAPERLDDYDYTRDPDHVAPRQNELRGDLQAVQSYGEEHADEYTSVRFVNRPSVSIVAAFTDNLDRHRDALRRIVKNPDIVDVERGYQTAAQLETMQRSVFEKSQGQLRGSGGRSSGIVDVNLNPTAAGRDVAADLEAAYGDLVCVSLANHPYPKGAFADTDQCTASDVPSDRVEGVVVELRLPAAQVRRGEVVRATAHVTNNTARRLEFFGGSDITGYVVSPGGSRPLGGLLGVFHDAAGRNYVADAGGSVDMPVTIGTDDCRKDADYALPAGRYGVVTSTKTFGRSNEATLDIVE